MRTRTRTMIAVLATVAVACTGAPPEGSPSEPAPVRGDVLVFDLGRGATSIDTAAGQLSPATLDAVASFDGSRLYRTQVDGDVTVLQTLDPGGGVLTETSVPGSLEVRVASVSGEAVVLMPPLPQGVDPWTPVPRTMTELVIADPGGGEARPFRLRGNYEPEAISADDRRVFLLQYLPAEAPAAYRVVSLDIGSGDVSPVAGRFKTPPERMPGIRLSQVYDPVMERLYTLYDNRPSSGLDHAYAGHGLGGEQTFVHVLSLRDGWAHCAGVPRSMWGSPRFGQAMAVTPDGAQVYLIDVHAGQVATLDARSLRISSVRPAALGTEEGVRTTATVAPDGRTIYITSSRDASSLYLFDTASGSVDRRWPVTGPASAVGVTLAGVYVAGPGSLEQFDADTGQVVRTVPLPGVDRIVHVLPGG